MNDRVAVGTPVTVKNMYGEHGNNDLVVMTHANKDGYGIGPVGNDPTKAHSYKGWLYYPNSYVTPKEESKTVTKFNKGDKVRFSDKSNTAWFGVEGIVEVPGSGYSNKLRLTTAATGWASHFTVGSEARISDQYLELVEDTFTFKDIQKGDTIRRTRKHKGGATEVREGVVGKKGSWYWATEDDQYILAYETDTATNKEGVTLELVNRPEPEPTKEEWETAKPGDRLVVKNKEGVTRILTKQADGEWDALLIKPYGVSVGITRSDQSVKGQLQYENFNVGTPTFIKA